MKTAGSSAWSNGRRLAVVSGVWCYFAVLLAINNYVYPAIMGQPVTWWEAARFPLITYSLWTLFTPLIFFFCERVRRLQLATLSWTMAHSAFALLTLTVIAAIWIPFTEASGDLEQIPRLSLHFLSILFWQSVAWNLWVYWVIVGMFYGFNYYFDARDSRLRAARLEGQLARAELAVLKGQLQPHFLFNTLNMVSSLVHTDAASADDMIGDLGALLRISLESRTAQEVTLAQEMQAIELYLNIQRLRFQDTLSVDMRIDPHTLEAKLPHLILQPLVENAFRHGISKRVGPGRLKIETLWHGADLVVRIADNGPGAGVTGDGGGIGLSNTRARLEILYGDRAELLTTNSTEGFVVELRLPLVIAAASREAVLEH